MYELRLEKASLPKALKNIGISEKGITTTVVEYERDQSQGQIDIKDVIVTLEANNRPKRGNNHS